MATKMADYKQVQIMPSQQKKHILSMKLFIVSEVMFFFAFFWAFFYSSISPSIWIGGVWPPKGIEVINAWGLPFFNTILLLSSGVTLTWSHCAFAIGNRHIIQLGLI